MPHLWGRDWTKRELLERVGDLAQVAGIERFTYTDGVREGVRAARVRTGGGLEFTALLSRGLDISHALYRGMPLGWISQTGEASPRAFEPQGRGWLRTFYGGLVTTCGLSNAGAANVDDGEELGIHGRLSHTPAEEECVRTEWDGNEANLVIEGMLREARVFHENLRLRRRIVAPVGRAEIRIEDTVENSGFKTLPLMLLYHINLGWPLVSEETEIVLPSRGVEARDADALPGLEKSHRMEAPQAGYAEQVFFHDAIADARGVVPVLMVHRGRNVALRIAYERATLPWLTQWKMMGRGEYVCGIEPANCRVLGRAAERAAGRLQTIEGGETRRFAVTLTVLDGVDAIAAAEAEVRRIQTNAGKK